MTANIAGALRTDPEFLNVTDLRNMLKMGERVKVVPVAQYSHLRIADPMTGTASVTGTNSEPVGVEIAEGYVTRVIG